MRGVLVLLFAAGLLVFGCAGGPDGGNQTVPDAANLSNTTPISECSGPVCGSDGLTYESDCQAELAGVPVEYAGECLAPAESGCIDSDGGIEPAVSGAVSKGNETHSDYCLDAAQLVEYSCLDNAMQAVTVQCGQGKACESGQCVLAAEENRTQNITPPVQAGCSGPAENDMFQRQTTLYMGANYTDSCVDYRVVKEYYCKGDKLESINNQCPSGYGCTDGQCNWLQVVCDDSDGGNDTSKRGRITVIKGYLTIWDFTDECIDEGKVKEYYCLENGSVAYDDLLCPSGTKCLNDRCIPGECSETDGGFNTLKFGITSDKSGDFEDECLSDYELREYFCYGDEADFDDVKCDKGYICNGDSGRCVEGSVD